MIDKDCRIMSGIFTPDEQVELRSALEAILDDARVGFMTKHRGELYERARRALEPMRWREAIGEPLPLDEPLELAVPHCHDFIVVAHGRDFDVIPYARH